MTLGSRPTLVGAVFSDREKAGEAAAALRDEGLTDEELTTAVWNGDRYVISSHAGAEIWRGLLAGAVIGAVLGSAAGAVAAGAFFGSATTIVAVMIGAATGTTAGGFWGAYLGINRYRSTLWDQRDWTHLELDQGQVLIVLPAEHRPGEVADILRDHDGRRVEPVHPQ